MLISLFQHACVCALCVCVQVQPVAELVELSRRWAADGRQIRLNDVIAKGGTLRRTGSLRHRATKVLPFFFFLCLFQEQTTT